MLIPLPAMPAQIGPASEYANRRRPVLLALLIFQTLVCIARMVLLLDIMGGFIMAIMIGLGWYAWSQEMNITFICYWGMLCLINGVFDLVKLIDHLVKKGDIPLFSSELPYWYNMLSATLVCIPVSALLGLPLAWFLYKDYTEGDMSEVQGFHAYAPPDRRAPNPPSYGTSGPAPASSFLLSTM